MSRRRLIVSGIVVVAVVIAAVAIRLGATFGDAVINARSGPNAPVPIVTPPSPGDISPYLNAIELAGNDGLRVWIEADLVKRWRAGQESFQQGIDVIAQEAKSRAVVGIKIADELGYHDGLRTSAEISAFLDASAKALRARAPGKLILVDVVVPELGCLPGYEPAIPAATACDAQSRRDYPQLTLSAFDGYLARHDIDALDVSAYLRDDHAYASWGVNTDTAERVAWQSITGRGWARFVTLNARKALAHPGAYDGDAAGANATLHTFVDIPRQSGAEVIDLWTWRQLYEGQIYRLMNPGPAPNALWDAILTRHRAGVRLFTHFSPSSVESSVANDMKLLATAFTDVFVAAGTG
jgi:hypothetical protein